jgi:AraC family ethanolamine operon transcriptional activator
MRTLIYSFKDWFGMGPIAYLKLLRLNAVHRRLKEPRESVRIFDVAADFGFWHMGHFSTNYKRVFGVTPTQTVSAARSRDK